MPYKLSIELTNCPAGTIKKRRAREKCEKIIDTIPFLKCDTVNIPIKEIKKVNFAGQLEICVL